MEKIEEGWKGLRKRVEETLFSPAIRVRVEEGVKREKKG